MPVLMAGILHHFYYDFARNLQKNFWCKVLIAPTPSFAFTVLQRSSTEADIKERWEST
jgi:hypothetical protein